MVGENREIRMFVNTKRKAGGFFRVGMGRE